MARMPSQLPLPEGTDSFLAVMPDLSVHRLALRVTISFQLNMQLNASLGKEGVLVTGERSSRESPVTGDALANNEIAFIVSLTEEETKTWREIERGCPLKRKHNSF